MTKTIHVRPVGGARVRRVGGRAGFIGYRMIPEGSLEPAEIAVANGGPGFRFVGAEDVPNSAYYRRQVAKGHLEIVESVPLAEAAEKPPSPSNKTASKASAEASPSTSKDKG